MKPQAYSEVSEEDVRGMIAEGAKTGVFQPEEQELVERVFRVGDLRVASIMVPRSDIVWLNEGDTAQRVRITVGTSPYSHFPVCRGNMDQLLGVVHVKDLVKYGLIAGTEINVSELAQEPLFVPETTPVLNLLDLFEQNRTHIAFIVDEYGATQGLVTLSDVTAAILGEIKRRGDEEPPDAVRRPDGSWLVDGSLPLHELAEIIGLAEAGDEDQPEVNTVAGIVLALLGHIPHPGETVDWRGWRFEVMDMDRQRVDKVLATRLPPTSDPRQSDE
jgi:putative hemolysin